MTNDDFRYRRQFLLTHSACESFNHWQHQNVGDFHLYAHPDIELCVTSDANTTLALVGYIIDPYHPETSNIDILKNLMAIAHSFEKVTDALSSLSGRFVLIIKNSQDLWLFHDPCGLRSIYYTEHQGKLLAGSQPNLLKHVMPIEDETRLSSYLQSTYVQANREHWIPSGCSLYDQVNHLVPNHALCVSTMKQKRYWPKKAICEESLDVVTAKAADLLSKLMIAGNKRFKLALPLTAGWDSRMLLSASKSISSQMYFYTLQYRNLNANASDIKLPNQLLSLLGLHHHIINCRKEMPAAFREIYQQNTSPAHLYDWGDIAYGMRDAYPRDRVCIKGNCSEIARCFYYKFGTHHPIESPDQIIALEEGWEMFPFVHDQISAWFLKAKEVCASSNMDILDLFYWEHRMGSWQAQSQLEWDLVQEAYTPFNQRELLEILLSVPTKFRCAPNYSLYKMIMQLAWPEVLNVGINPLTTKQFVQLGLKRLGLYEIFKKVHKRFS